MAWFTFGPEPHLIFASVMYVAFDRGMGGIVAVTDTLKEVSKEAGADRGMAEVVTEDKAHQA